jgi:hypothetical protein
MACTIGAGIGIACQDLRRAGGLNKRFWLGNIDDLATPFSATLNGYVTNIPFSTYRSLYKFEGPKFSHSFEINEQTTEGGNTQWEHKLIAKLLNTAPQEDRVIEDLSVSEVFAVVQTSNAEFLILGAANGMTSDSSKLKSGKKPGDDSTTELQLTGLEQSIYKRLLITDFNTTLAYLNALSVANTLY